MYSSLLTKRRLQYLGAKANEPENIDLRANSRENTKHTHFYSFKFLLASS